MTYAFRSAPSYPAARRNEVFASAFEQPLSVEETFFTSARSGALESFGLGTAIRDFGTPRGQGEPNAFQRALTTSPITAPFASGYEALRGIFGAQDEEPEPLSEQEYRSSAFFRAEVPWDAGMTKARAEALASWYDAKKVREFYSEKRPFASFLGYLGGQALDPINYLPVAGPLVKGAAVARLGVVGGHIATASLDAAANTAVFGLATANERRAYGDDVSWQSTVSQIATAALIGAAFGGASGGLAKRSIRLEALRVEAKKRIATLRETQEARIALNEAVDGLASRGEVELSPNAVEPIARSADVGKRDIEAIQSAAVVVDGQIFRGVNHAEAAERAAAETGETLDLLFGGEKVRNAEGFVTTTGRYVGRAEAERIAKRAGQMAPDEESGIGLLAEQLNTAEPVVSGNIDPGAAPATTVDAPAPDWWRAANQDAVDAANRMGLTEQIGDMARAGKTAAEISAAIGGKLEVAEVRAVRDALGIAPAGPMEGIGLRGATAVDTSAARPDPAPEGRPQAEASVAKSEDYKFLAEQHRVDPETGAYPEEADIKQLETEGRLTEADKEALDAANENYANGDAWGKALRAAVNCLI